MHEIVEKMTKMNQELQNQKLRLLAKVDLKIKLKIFQEQKPIFHKLKGIHSDIDNAVLTLSSLILAIDSTLKELGLVELNVAKLRGANNKPATKRDKVLGYWGIIKDLRAQKVSFQKIPQYMLKYHKFDVSYSTIYSLWCELEKNKEN